MLNSDDTADYIDQVVDRARKLIHARVWEGMKDVQLDSWMGCLRNYDAELLGAYLLDNLAFRSRDQFFSLLDTLFVDLSSSASKTPTIPLLDQLRLGKSASPNFGVRIAPVIGHLAPPTKSGPYILRLAQRRFRIHSDWLIWPHMLAHAGTVTDLYFLDDFCGTGEQFEDFVNGIRLNEFVSLHPHLQVTYLVTTIHPKGLDRIAKLFPYIKVKWAELLSDLNAPLSDSCLRRYQVKGFADMIHEQYRTVVSKAGLPQKGRLAEGYGELGLAYAFSHATPNNSLPVFWYETPSFTPLLDR
ncbi:MAG: hypothetical protein HZB95_12245 [Nitrosomonadales bacterium]|nr:hypothetical protein [Nitrosomonadales bacterium]